MDLDSLVGDVVLVLVSLLAGLMVGRWLTRKNPKCVGCHDSLSCHDPKTGECYADEWDDTKFVRCTCRQYVDPGRSRATQDEP